MTDAASQFIEQVNGVKVMSPDWSIIGTIASPNRQADVVLELLVAIDEDDAKSGAGRPQRRPAENANLNS